jgi:hypothetical protein
VVQNKVNLFRAKRVPVCRHHAIESASWAAVMDDSRPILVWFPRGELAIGKIGEGDLKTDRGNRNSSSVRAVASGAGGVVEFLSGSL